jgi:hypothetical protein
MKEICEMKLEDTGAIMLTPMEFCRKTGIRPTNWIFNDMPENSKFFMYESIHNTVVNEPEKYFFNNGKIIREFKYMKEYDETWMRVFDMTVDKPCWSSWNTWKVS